MIIKILKLLSGNYPNGTEVDKIITNIEIESKKIDIKGKKLISKIEKTPTYYILKAMGAIQQV